MLENKKPNFFPGIDLFKLIGAVFVVAIHSHPFEDIFLPPWLELVYVLFCNTAVPFFFIASGFFLGYKPLSVERLLEKLKAFAWMYVVAFLCYFPLDALVGWADQPSVGRLVLRYTKRFFILGGTNHLIISGGCSLHATLCCCFWEYGDLFHNRKEMLYLERLR